MKKKNSAKNIVSHTLVFLVFGAIMGMVSKFLDTFPSNYLPYLMQIFDIPTFLDGFAIWIFIAIIISIYSKSPERAALYVFIFFLGMISSYYLYSNYVAGFFPRTYAMIWFSYTALSPVLAFICWYAKGKEKISILITAGIIAVMFNLAFSYGWFYIYIHAKRIPELILLLLTIFVLRREKKEMAIVLALSVPIAIALQEFSPIQFW